ncbi:MAG: hypothetical protein LUF87_04190 [Alistipes sp.]|nr:hypothetical protein [Alistipes sp.]
MKKILFIATIISSLVISIICYSCKNEKVEQIEEFSELSYDDVGILHNDGLNFILDYLKKNGITTENITRGGTSFGDIELMIDTATEEFLRRNQISNLPITRAGIENKILDFNLLSEKQKEYTLLLLEAFVNPGDLNEVLSEIKAITENIKSDLSKEEADPILYGASVALYTAEYWYNNSSIWYETLGEDFVKSRGWFSWSDFGGDDVSGAIGGAVAGVIVGGGGAGPGALAGGIAASTTNAVKQIWNQFF